MTTKPPAHAYIVALVRDLVSGYTRHHQELRTEGATMGDDSIVLAIKGNRDDHPKLVGTQGKHIVALQTIMGAVSTRLGKRINLTLLEPDTGTKGPPAVFKPAVNWNPEPMIRLLRRVLDAALPCGYEVKEVVTLDLTTLEVKPREWGGLLMRGDFAKSVHALFHAIGKSEGRNVHIEFTPPNATNDRTGTRVAQV